MDIGAIIVIPDLFCPRIFTGWTVIEEQDVRLNTICIKDIPQYGVSQYEAGYLKKTIEIYNSSFLKNNPDRNAYYGGLLAMYHMRACIIHQEAYKSLGGLRAMLGFSPFDTQKAMLAGGINAEIDKLLSFEESNDWQDLEFELSNPSNEA